MKRIILLLLLVICCFRITNAEDSSAEMDLQVKKQIESKFLNGDTPSRYYSNILIRLEGNPTKVDSLIFKQLVDTLNVLIDKWDVYLIPKGTSNLEVEINNPDTEKGINKILTHPDNGEEIVKRTVVLNLPSELDFIARKRTIYYYVLRSLVGFKFDQSKAIPISGSIFTEADPARISFLPVDFEIIKEVYSTKYENRYNRSGNSDKWKFYNKYVFINLLAIFLSAIFLIFISQKGSLKKHHYEFRLFFKQGFLAFIAFLIYFGIRNVFSSIAFLQRINSSDLRLFMVMILVFLLVGLISIPIIYMIERSVLKEKDNFMLEIMVPLLTTMVVPVLVPFLGIFFIERMDLKDNPLRNDSMVLTTIISYSTLMGIARAFYIFMSVKSENIIRKKDLELAHMNELHKQAELQSLRAKINPHFLYNALNSIASLATTDARKTEQMALALSDFFKYAINREQKQLNTLSEELNAIRTYLEIEKVRFGERLSFEIDCPEALMNIQIPQLLIQPLVENAIKHGLSHITDSGLIRISVCQAETQLKIRVYDNGPAFPEGPLTGFGIQNTQERIVLLYGAKATINWQNGAEKYIEIKLPVLI